MLWILLGVVGCAQPQACPACPDCPTAAPAPAAELGLDPWQTEQLRPAAERLREGVRLQGEQGFGVCQGTRRCERFLGAEADTLPPGDYLVRAELDVPELGEGWKASFTADCTVTSATGRTRQRHHERTYDLTHTSGAHGYRLEPLWRIQSPHTDGARRCQLSLTAIRPDGQAQEPFKGSYSTPAPPLR